VIFGIGRGSGVDVDVGVLGFTKGKLRAVPVEDWEREDMDGRL